MTVEGQSGTIGTIQSLRGIAAFMVVVFHLTVQTDRLGFPPVEITALASGVDIFFVISGFIMWVTTATRPDRGAAAFYRDRIARIVPLYWAITAFMAAILIISPHLLQTAVFDPRHVILSFLFLPATNPGTGSYMPLLIPGWTLNYEMFFYLLFGISIAVGRRNLRLRAALIVAALAILVVLGRILPAPGAARFYTYDIMLEFAFGIGLGVLYLRGGIPRSLWWWLVAGLGATLLAFSSFEGPQDIRALEWGIPATLIVAAALFAPPLRLNSLEKLGDWSYALYLSHPIVLSAAGQGWRLLGASAPLMLFPPLALLACVAAAAALYRFLERPTQLWLKEKLSPRRQAGAAPVATG